MSFFTIYLFIIGALVVNYSKILSTRNIDSVEFNAMTKDTVVNNAIDFTYPVADHIANIDHYYGRITDTVLYNGLAFAVTNNGNVLVFNFTMNESTLVSIWENRLFGPNSEEIQMVSTKIAIRNSTAYIGLANYGLIVLNVSNPIKPTLISHLPEIINRNLAIFENNLFVYYNSYSTNVQKITIYDIQNMMPVYMGEIDNIYFIRGLIINFGYICKRTENVTSLYQLTSENDLTEILSINQRISSIAIEDELLFCCSNDYNFRIYNISESSNPNLITNISLPYYFFYEVVISGDFAYIRNYWDIYTINISSVIKPILIGEYNGSFWGAGLLKLSGFKDFVDDKIFLYWNYYHGLSILNFTNPNNPSFKPLFNEINFPYDFKVNNNLMFIAANGMLEIYNVTYPEAPEFLCSYKARNIIYDILLLDNIAILAELNKGIEIINVTNASNPKFMSYFNNFTIYPNGCSSVSLSLDSGNMHLYVANSYSGVAILDINNHSQPVLIKEIQPNKYGTTKKVIFYNGKLYAGTAGVDWSLGSFNVYDVGNPTSPILTDELQGIDAATEFFIDDNYLYLSITNWLNSIRIYDLRNGVNYNSLVSTIDNLNYIKDINVRNKTIFVVNNLAYSVNVLSIIDITNIQKPKLITEYYGQNLATYLVNVIIDKEYLYINEGWNGIQIFKIINWPEPTIDLAIWTIPCFLVSFIIIVSYSRKKQKK